jgi:hypothetical protein
MKKPRRRFLFTLGTVTGTMLSGCISDKTVSDRETDARRESQNRDTEDQSRRSTVPAPTPGTLTDELVNIEEGEFVAYDFTIDSEIQLDYNITVTNNVRVDIFVISTGGFVRYKRDQFIEPVAATEDTSGDSGQFRISKGNYYFVIDHTKKLEAEPPGQFESVPAKVEIKVTY